MTAWTTITNALVAVGAKPFASTMQALRDNPVAAFEGDPTAVAAGVTLRQAATERLVAGDAIRLRNDATSASVLVATTLQHAFVQGGQIRVFFSHRHVTGGANVSRAFIQRQRAGVSFATVATWDTASTGFVNRSADVDIQPGDIIRIQHQTVGSGNSEVANSRFQVATGQVVWPSQTMYGLVENPLI
jgi:hypothetical protein